MCGLRKIDDWLRSDTNVAHKAEAGKTAADPFAGSKLFTADKVAAARARLKSKLCQLNSGIAPELLVDGMAITGAYIEFGVRKFSDYAKAIVENMGDGVKPYLLSFWEDARNYPCLDNKGITYARGLRARACSIADAQGHRHGGREPAECYSLCVPFSWP